ncbi:zinc finger CCCH domain-containing protein 13-like isoform X2 [Coregonus clupeaformis]|uniref:zinc finger CCCH domain-containing protein 13-like isoform X2 n=1 Tax=Coregonus clupeaformis TaxID=59861 RepID=UPI001E1C481E|nr:zinc finger CCCH domain-containing protein 13-like isoform X2 [Coregonus clupeaformis]
MSTWYMDGAEDNRGGYTKQGPESLLQSERRRMKLQSDLVTLQRDERLSRAVRLQCRWQELSERERRAQQQNRQLLQEFDRAQDTLRDMVTRTTAMNTIRVEYERYLEESFPRWQQQLKQKTLSAQRKRMEQHMKECLRSMEEDRGEERGSRPPIGAQPPLSPCHVQQLQNAAAHQEHHNQNGHQDYIQNGHHHPSIPSIQSSGWLIHARSQLANSQTRMHSKLQQRDMTHHPAHPLHPYCPQSLHPPQPYPVQPPQSYSTHSKPHIVIQQETPPAGYPMQWPAGVAAAALPFRAPVGLQTSWTSPAMPDTQGWRMVQGVAGEDEGREASAATSPEGGSSVGHRQRREKSSDLAHELDIKPVRLWSGHGESSESSRTSSQASKESVGSRERRNRKEKKGGRGGQSSTDRSSAGSGEVVIAVASVSSASVVQSSENDGTSVAGSNKSRRSRGLANSVSAEESGSHREESGSHRAESRSKMQESMIQMESVSHREEVASEKEVPENDMEATEGEEESLVGLSVEEGATVEEEEEIEHDREEGRETEEEEVMGEHDGETEQREGQDEYNEASQRDREEEEVQPESENVSIREHTAEDEEEEERGEEEAEEVQDSEGQVEREEVEWSDRDKEEESENEREESHTSQDGEIEEVVKGSREEEEDVGAGGKRDEDDEGSGGEEEEQRCQDAEEDSAAGQPEDEEERDSDDSIISPPEHRSSKGLAEVVEEEEEEEVIDDNEENEGEDDEGDKVKGYSWSVDPFPDEDDDIESLLAPQAKSQEKQEKEKEKTVVLVKPKAIDEDLDSLSEVKALHKKKGANQDTDSEEFDHFYD